MINQVKNKSVLNLSALVSSISNQLGAGSLLVHDDSAPENFTIPVISSGSLALDNITGVGGYPVGKIIEIFGPESSGKTTLALTAVSKAQANNQLCAFIDAEHALNQAYCDKLNIDLKKLVLCQPNSGEHAFSVMEKLLITQKFHLIVVDSVAALTTKQEIEGDLECMPLAAQARLMSRGLRRIVPLAAKNNCTIIFINQVREKVNNGFGFNEVTPGGRALKFYAFLRVDVRKKETIKDADNNFCGNKMQIMVAKNKAHIPFRKAYVTNYYGQGIDQDKELIDFAITKKLIVPKGSWYYFEEKQLGHGLSNAISKVKSDANLKKAITDSLAKIGTFI